MNNIGPQLTENPSVRVKSDIYDIGPHQSDKRCIGDNIRADNDKREKDCLEKGESADHHSSGRGLRFHPVGQFPLHLFQTSTTVAFLGDKPLISNFRTHCTDSKDSYVLTLPWI